MLVGCTNPDGSTMSSDQIVAATVDQVCSNLGLADAGFQFYVAQHPANGTIMRAEADAYAAGTAACANRNSGTMKAVVAALAAIAKAEQQAKGG
jgi:hypothetical protein